MDKIETVRKTVLKQAECCVCGQREEDYGSPEDSFKAIGQLWTIYTGHLITAKDVAMMMALLKIARIMGGKGTMDSYVDLAGYAACGAEVAMREQELPCKVGDELWAFCSHPDEKVYSFTVTDISTLNGRTMLNTSRCGVIDARDVSKTVFLTREEAEKALEAWRQ